ncbi:MAG: hypothetical protein ACE5HW_03170 [Candidatus Methanofastidiosia archaeon]
MNEAYEEVLELLATGLLPEGYEREKFKSVSSKILDLVFPTIALKVKISDEPSEELWNFVKRDEEIVAKFGEASKKFDRVVVIFFMSKFQNNKKIGLKIIEKALEVKR